jgi:membrane protease YdiL (CAAX protease family)
MQMKRAFFRIGVGLAGVVLFVAVLLFAQSSMHRAHLSTAAASAALLPVMFGTYALIVGVSERRPLYELAPRFAASELIGGTIFGVLIFSIVIAALFAAGIYSVRSIGSASVLAPALLFWFSSATAEELIFRGFVFRVVQSAGGTWVAVAISAVLFGAVHAANPASSVFSTIAIALEAGVLLALAYAATQRLWLPIGIHTGWNFAEGTIYGTAVSGGPAKVSLLHARLAGPDLLTGGAFGIEASIGAILICVAASVLLAIYALRTGRIVPLKVAARPVVESPVR